MLVAACSTSYTALGNVRRAWRAPAPVAVAAARGWEDLGGARIRFREGELTDSLPIAGKLLAMKMNPLAVDHTRFIVCEDSGGARIGFGQIRKLANRGARDPAAFEARPGTRDIEADVDEDAWEDFERETSLPMGLIMPWSEEYKALDERAALQRARRRSRVAQAKAEAEPLWELASIYVEDDWRGCGIGGAIVRRLLARHMQEGQPATALYLLTLEPTTGWYEKLGFQKVGAKSDVPAAMAFEVAAGEALSALLGNQLVCMRGCAGGGS